MNNLYLIPPIYKYQKIEPKKVILDQQYSGVFSNTFIEKENNSSLIFLIIPAIIFMIVYGNKK